MAKHRGFRSSPKIHRARGYRARQSRLEGLEARNLLTAEVLRLSPSYLENLGVVESAFIERVRAADRSGDDRVTTRDVLLSMDNPDQFYATLDVLDDWRTEVSKDIARRLYSLDPERWTSLGAATGDPPLGEGDLPPPGGGSGGNGGGTWHGDNPGGGEPIYLFGVPHVFDIDAAVVKVVNKAHTPTGVLHEDKEDSEGAWVLVNSDNDDFNQVTELGVPVPGELGADESQTSPVVNEDDLLPVVLRAVPSYPDGYFWLTYTSGIRVYEDAQKTTLATGFYPSGADTQLFVEGLSMMVATEINYDILQINLVDELYSYVSNNVDSIRINRFAINGPTSVPVGARYIYNAFGVDPTVSGWVNPTQGTKTPVQWDHAASFNDWQEIKWNTTEEDGKQSMEKAVYELPNGYQWGFDVARVQVSVIANDSEVTLEGHVEQMSGADRDRAITTTPLYSSSVDGSQRPMMAVARISIEGPKKNGRVRGSGEIEVGFVQNLTIIRQYGDYEGAITWDTAMPHNVPILDSGSALDVWYDHDNNTGDYFHSGPIDDFDGTDFDGYETYSVPTGPGQGAAQNYWIDMGDGPRAFMAPSWRDQVLVDNWLDQVYGKWHFSLYVAARTTQAVITSHANTPTQFLDVTSITDPQSAITPDASLRLSPLDSSNLYFQQAYANWDFVFDGDIDSYTWNSSPASGLVGDALFTSMASNPGTLVPSTMGLPANHYLAQIAYDGFSGWNRRTP